jgi:hypothetical protein
LDDSRDGNRLVVRLTVPVGKRRSPQKRWRRASASRPAAPLSENLGDQEQEWLCIAAGPATALLCIFRPRAGITSPWTPSGPKQFVRLA